MFRYVFPDVTARVIIIISLIVVILWNNLVSLGNARYNLYSPCPKRISHCLLLLTQKEYGHDHRVPLFAFISQCILLIFVIVLIVLDILHVSFPESVMLDLPRWILKYYAIPMALLSVIDGVVYDVKHKNDI